MIGTAHQMLFGQSNQLWDYWEMLHVWGEDKGMQGCGWETERNHLEDLSLDGG
jgi:hypothetical protein